MAFKAFNWRVMRDLDMDQDEVHNAYHAAMFVFGIQLLMIIFVGSVVLQDSFNIQTPQQVTVLGARFVCTILMHLQVENDMRQGLRMMKYVTNQPFDFSNPGSAFSVAMMQCLGGLAAEIACIVYLSTIILTQPLQSCVMCRTSYFCRTEKAHKDQLSRMLLTKL